MSGEGKFVTLTQNLFTFKMASGTLLSIVTSGFSVAELMSFAYFPFRAASLFLTAWC